MAIMDRFRGHNHASPASSTMIDQDPEEKPQMLKGGAKEIFRVRIIAMAVIVSMGGVRSSDTE
jgi:SP family sugar:H+ symporter-like MFS transporter